MASLKIEQEERATPKWVMLGGGTNIKRDDFFVSSERQFETKELTNLRYYAFFKTLGRPLSRQVGNYAMTQEEKSLLFMFFSFAIGRQRGVFFLIRLKELVIDNS